MNPTFPADRKWLHREARYNNENLRTGFLWVGYNFSTGKKWVQWLRVGLVAEHTKAFQTVLQIQRGILVGSSHKKWEFTTYEFNAGWTDPTVVLEAGISF